MAKTKINSTHYVNISKSSITMWRNFYNDGFNFLANYQFLTDSYVLDFFSEDLWQSIPPPWGEALQSFSPEQLSALLHPPSSQSSQSNRIGAVLPLSLLAFRSAAFAYTLPREAVSSPSPFFEYMKHCYPTSNFQTDAESALNCFPSKAPPSSHVNSTKAPTNHICPVVPLTGNVGREFRINKLCSKSKMPLLFNSSSGANEGIHTRAIAELNFPTEIKPIDGTTNCCNYCNTLDVSLLAESSSIISHSKVNVAVESLMNDRSHSKHSGRNDPIGPPSSRSSCSTASNVCDKIGNQCSTLNLGTVGNCLVNNSELPYSSKQEISCNVNKNDESHESRSVLSHCNGHHKYNGIGNRDTESSFEENNSKNDAKTKQDRSHCLLNDSNTRGVCSQQKRYFSSELSVQSCSERRSLSNADDRNLQRKLRWTCNKNQDMVPAWPATNVDSIVWGTSDSELTKAGGQHRLLSHVFRRHVKPKKQHEVARLGLIAAFASAATRSDVTSDVGSGCGHLARLMSYGHRLRVVCVDKEEDFVKGARQFDDQLEKSMSKMKRHHVSRGPLNEDQQLQQGEDDQYQLPAGPRHAACLLRLGGDVHTFAQTVLSRWPDLPTTNASFLSAATSRTQATGFNDKSDVDSRSKCRHSEAVDECCSSGRYERARLFGLTGLHTCGDLAATLLDVFLRTPHCRYLASVACCYMKLTTTPETPQDGTPPGYPLSQHCRQQPHQTVSYAARELACHAIEAYRDRLLLGADNLKVHCYRAALETIIVKHWPHLKRAGLRSVKNAHTKPFHVYAVSAVSALEDGRLQLPDADLNSPETLDRLSRWRQVVVFYTLRLLLAPVVETVLLLDRSFYLYEQGVDSVLVPTFDPKLSPRNVVLLAIKPD